MAKVPELPVQEVTHPSEPMAPLLTQPTHITTEIVPEMAKREAPVPEFDDVLRTTQPLTTTSQEHLTASEMSVQQKSHPAGDIVDEKIPMEQRTVEIAAKEELVKQTDDLTEALDKKLSISEVPTITPKEKEKKRGHTRSTRSTTHITGLVLEDRYADYHYPPADEPQHVEVPIRVRVLNKSFFSRLSPSDPRHRKNRGYSLINPHEATNEEILLCHTPEHIARVLSFSTDSPEYLPCDTYVCPSTIGGARLAAGGVIDLAVKIAKGEVANGMAVVRPPGHHAEADMSRKEAWGFCFFNNIAIAAAVLKRDFGMKVMIIDWDIHHCNGTQDIFYNDNDVLVVSLHRYSEDYFPGTGAINECGNGYNVNIAWDFESCKDMKNGDYIGAWKQVIEPISAVFKPNIVLVSCGFDAARDDPIGRDGLSNDLGRDVNGLTGSFFGDLTTMTMDLPACDGKVMLVLEGGYVADGSHGVLRSATACLDALRGLRNEVKGAPTKAAQRVLNDVIEAQREYWADAKFPQPSTVSQQRDRADSETLSREIEKLTLPNEYGEYGMYGGYSMV